MAWPRTLVFAALVSRAASTYKGFVNPLKHYDAETGSFWVLNLTDSESADDLSAAIGTFLTHKDQYLDTVALHSRQRVGEERCHPLLVDTQNIWPTVERLRDAGFPVLGRYINVGASDGQVDDPLFEYAGRANATGVAVERDPARCERHRQALPQVDVACSAVTPQNVLGLVGKLITTPPTWLDVLKVDIDSYDCPVLEVLLEAVKARIILVETNPSIPPPYQWAMLHHPELWDFFNGFHSPEEVPIRGCSLSYEVDLLQRFGYDFVAFGGHDAIFTHRSVRQAWSPLKVPMDEFDCYNEAFIAANGIPIDLTRRWFFELSDTQAVLPEIWAFFSDWMSANARRLFPFALRG